MKAQGISLFLCLLICLTADAQTQKGRWTVGTQFGNFSYQKQDNDYRNLTGNITPSAGYFLANGLVVGTGVPFSFNTTKFGQLYANYYNLRQTGNSIGLSPFVRYYFGAAKLKPFLGVSYSYSWTTTKYTSDNAAGARTKNTGYTTTLTPNLGLAYFVTPNLGLTASLNYSLNHVEYSTVETSPYTPGGSNANYDTRLLSLSIGFQIFLGQ